jgi:hypothetical protein
MDSSKGRMNEHKKKGVQPKIKISEKIILIIYYNNKSDVCVI